MSFHMSATGWQPNWPIGLNAHMGQEKDGTPGHYANNTPETIMASIASNCSRLFPSNGSRENTTSVTHCFKMQ